jgi:hypothetical protein
MFLRSLICMLLFVVYFCPSFGINPYSKIMKNYFLSKGSTDSPFMPSYSNSPLMSSTSYSSFLPSSVNLPFTPLSSNSYLATTSSKHPFINPSSNSLFMPSEYGFPFMYHDTSEGERLTDSRSNKKNKNYIPFPKAFWTFVSTLVVDLNLKEPETLMRIKNAYHCIQVDNYLHEARKQHLQVMINIFCTMQSKMTVKQKCRSQRNKKNIDIDMFGPVGRSVSVIIKPNNAFYTDFKLTQMGHIVYSYLKKITSTPLSSCFFENSLR